ncbi:DNA polymerase III subunit beta [Candidatus Azambacteria bacterium]|nr:DNA polymerase III subunit beta [Candidatus Azambacteria bacterium]
MRIICLQENLKNNLLTLERISSKNQELPILGNVLLKTEEGFLKAFATDLEIGVEIAIPCKIEKKGEAVVPIKLIAGFIANLPNTKLTLEEKNNAIVIETEGVTTTIPAANKNEFPIVPKIKEENMITMSGEALRGGIAQVINSAAISYTIPEIAGVLFVCGADVVKIVATDSFRLSEKTLFKTKEYAIKKEQSFILPAKTAAELSKIITPEDEIVEIYLAQNQVLFKLKHATIVSRLVAGEYPKYERIIPKTSTTKIALNKTEFISKLKLASLFSSKINDVKLDIRANKNEMELTAADQAKGNFSATIRADMTGESAEALFNYKYLLDGLSNISEEEIVFEVNGAASPAILKTKNDTYQYVAMPIKM